MTHVDLIHKALAHPFRREILGWLKAPEQFPAADRIRSMHGVALSAIHARSPLSQSTVSAHIAVLREAGLIVATQVGQWVFVSRNAAVIDAFLAHLHDCL